MSHTVTCPHCSTQIRVPDQNTHKTLFCPRCLAEVDNVGPGSQIRAADINTDVKRDLSIGSIILAALIGLCVLGIAIAFFSGLGKRGISGLGSVLALAFLFAVLDLLVIIAIIYRLVRWGTSGGRTPTVGRVLGLALLSLGTIVAVIILFFFTCMGLANIQESISR